MNNNPPRKPLFSEDDHNQIAELLGSPNKGPAFTLDEHDFIAKRLGHPNKPSPKTPPVESFKPRSHAPLADSSRGFVGATTAGVARGFIGIGEMATGAVAGVDRLLDRYVNAEPENDPDNFDLKKWAHGLRNDIEQGKNKLIKPTTEGKLGTWSQGVESFVTSAGIKVPAYIVGLMTGGIGAGLVGLVATSPAFGLAQYDEAVGRYTEEFKRHGHNDSVARNMAELPSLLEGSFEILSEVISDIIGGKLVAPGVVNSATKKIAASTLREMLKTGVYKAGAKKGGMIALSETAGEFLNSIAQGAVQDKYGKGKDLSDVFSDEKFWSRMVDELGPITVSSVLFGALGGGGHVYLNNKMARDLENPVAPIKDRQQAADIIYHDVAKENKTLAEAWRITTEKAIQAKEVISLDDKIDSATSIISPATEVGRQARDGLSATEPTADGERVVVDDGEYLDDAPLNEDEIEDFHSDEDLQQIIAQEADEVQVKVENLNKKLEAEKLPEKVRQNLEDLKGKYEKRLLKLQEKRTEKEVMEGEQATEDLAAAQSQTEAKPEGEAGEVEGQRGRKQIKASLNSLRAAKSVSDKVAAITRFGKNHNQNELAATKEEAAEVAQARKELTDQGFEIVELIGKKYNKGMKTSAEFVEDENLAEGEEIITKVRVPQINKDGVMVQSSSIVVAVGTKPTAPEKSKAGSVAEAPRVTAFDDLWQKTPRDTDNLWGEMQSHIDDVRENNAPRIDQIDDELDSLKGRRGKDVTARKKALREEKESLQAQVGMAESHYEEAVIGMTEKFLEQATAKARKAGVPEDEIDDFKEQLTYEISTERPYYERNHARKVEEIYNEVLDYFLNTEAVKATSEETAGKWWDGLSVSERKTVSTRSAGWSPSSARRISNTSWDKLTPAARNVLSRHYDKFEQPIEASPASEVEKATNEPWLLTADEFVTYSAVATELEPGAQSSSGTGTHEEVWRRGHKVIIKQALKTGRDIPERVLAEYPELTKEAQHGTEEVISEDSNRERVVLGILAGIDNLATESIDGDRKAIPRDDLIFDLKILKSKIKNGALTESQCMQALHQGIFRMMPLDFTQALKTANENGELTTELIDEAISRAQREQEAQHGTEESSTTTEAVQTPGTEERDRAEAEQQELPGEEEVVLDTAKPPTTFDAYFEKALGRYKDQYDADPELMAGKRKTELERWRLDVERAAHNKRLPDEVLDDYANRFGEKAFSSVFRGNREQKNYFPPATRERLENERIADERKDRERQTEIDQTAAEGKAQAVAAGAIFTKSGKPFKTRASAKVVLKAKKLTETHKVVDTDDGFVLVPVSQEEAKEPWQMTQEAFAENPPEDISRHSTKKDFLLGYHKRAVERAVSEGKSVPAEVLADYPNLKADLPRVEAETPPSAAAGAAKAEPPLTISDHSEKAIIVKGDTKTHKDRIKAVGGALWNRKHGGWIFSKKRREKVQAMVDEVNGETTKRNEELSPTDIGNENIPWVVDLMVSGQQKAYPGNDDLYYLVHKERDGSFKVEIGSKSNTNVIPVYGKGHTANIAYTEAVRQLKASARNPNNAKIIYDKHGFVPQARQEEEETSLSTTTPIEAPPKEDSPPKRTTKEIKQKAVELFASMDENQQAGIPLALFPAEVMEAAAKDGYSGTEFTVALMDAAKEVPKVKAQASEETGAPEGTESPFDKFSSALLKKGAARTPKGTGYKIVQTDHSGYVYEKVDANGNRTTKGGGYPAKWSRQDAVNKAMQEAESDFAAGNESHRGWDIFKVMDGFRFEKDDKSAAAGSVEAAIEQIDRIEDNNFIERTYRIYKNTTKYGTAWKVELREGKRNIPTAISAKTKKEARDSFNKFTGANDERRASVYKYTELLGGEPKTEKAWGSSNKLVTQDRAEELRKKLREKLGSQLSAGVDPELLSMGTELAVYHIEAGARKFTDFAGKMIADLGDAAKPFLKSWYMGAKNWPGVDRKGMDAEADVDNTNIDDILKSKEDIDNGTSGELTGISGEDGTLPERELDSTAPEDSGRPHEEVQPETVSGTQEGEPAKDNISANGESGVEPGAEDGEHGDVLVSGSTEYDDTGIHNPAAGGLESPATITDKNHVITDEDNIGKGGEAAKYNDNIAAIKLLKKIQLEGRRATTEEKKILSRYVGWGGLKNAFRNRVTGNVVKGWDKRVSEIEGLLTEDELEVARNSTKAAHYTSPTVVKSIWKIVNRLGVKGGNVLEPSMGIGNFLGLMPKGLSGRSNILGVEYDPITAGIAKLLYPQAGIYQNGFEKTALPSNAFDLVIGNPPFGKTRLSFKYKPAFNRHSIHNQFILAGVDALKPGGIQVFVVSRYFLDAANDSARIRIGEKAKLIGAIRLPDTAFKENARTEVVTDIIILQKKTAEELAADEAARKDDIYSPDAWVGTTMVNDPLGGDRMTVNTYFSVNPSMIVGQMERSGSMRTREDVTVRLDKKSNLSSEISERIERLPQDIAAKKAGPAASKAQFDAMRENIELRMKDSYASEVHFADDGSLVQTYEKEAPNNSTDYLLASRTITEDSPWHGSLQVNSDGLWYEEIDKLDRKGNKVKVVKNGRQTNRNEKVLKIYKKDTDVPKTKRLGKLGFDRLHKVTNLRDLVKRQLNLEISDTATDKEIEANRKELKQAYEELVAKHGHLNGQSMNKVLKLLPDGAIPLALEISYKKAITPQRAETLGVKPRGPIVKLAAILERRVRTPYKVAEHVENISDALMLSLAEKGGVDVGWISELTRKSEDEIIDELHSKADEPLIYKNPETDQWETAGMYLSGMVVKKLAAAREAGLGKNVTALEKVQPEKWDAGKVTIIMGGTWIPENIYAQFLSELSGDPNTRVEFSRITNTYVVRGDASSATAQRWNTPRRSILEIASAVLNSKSIRITATAHGRTYVDQEATDAANQRAEELKNMFPNWAFQDEGRRDILVNRFNERFNVRKKREFDGQHLTLPGKTSGIDLRTHQLNGVWRGVVENAVLYDHVVGSGKTYVAIARAMERKRLGLSNKPMIVVPNHIVDQLSTEALSLYPGANILTLGSEDLSKQKRRQMFARIATGDWDMVIVPHSSFEFINISSEAEEAYLQAELRDAETALAEAQRVSEEENTSGRPRKSLSVLAAENLVDNINSRLENVQASMRRGDTLLTFEQMGIDDLTIDEAHEFKNLFYHSSLNNVSGMGNPEGAGKAFDLWLKTKLLHEINGSIAFMTGTPISNSAVEMYNLMRYLAPDQLEDMGLSHFDAWRAQYATVSTAWEPTESGAGLKEVNRLGRDWANMRSLMELYQSFADSISNEDVARLHKERTGEDFPIPRVAGDGDRRAINVPPTPEQIQQIEDNVAGFEGLPALEWKERTAERLRLMDQARKLSLDARALRPGLSSDEKGGKLDVASGEIKRIYDKWDEDRGTQLVFLDRSVPKNQADTKKLREYDDLLAKIEDARNNGDVPAVRRLNDKLDKYDRNEMDEIRASQAANWNAYQQIKDNLVAMGIPESEIRFISDSPSKAQKADLFEEVNSGAVRVLIGSTPKLGAGTNVQKKLVALHHVDVTWKPSDIEQREGRIIRQGNELLEKYGDDFEIEIIAYTTERTIDAKFWALNSSKLKMINGIRNYQGEFNMEFDDESSLGMAEIAAIASGNVLQLERVKLSSEVDKLERNLHAFNRQRWGWESSLSHAKRVISHADKNLGVMERFVSRVKAVEKDVKERAEKRKVVVAGSEFKPGETGLAKQAVRGIKEGLEDKFSIEIDGKLFTSTTKADEYIEENLGDATFEGEIDGDTHIERKKFRAAIVDKLNNLLSSADDYADINNARVGTVKMNGIDFDITAQFVNDLSSEVNVSSLEVTIRAMEKDDNGKDYPAVMETFSNGIKDGKIQTAFVGELNAMERGLFRAGDEATMLRESAKDAKEKIPVLEGLLKEGWPKQEEFDRKQVQLEEVERQLAPQQRVEAGGDESEPSFSLKQPGAPTGNTVANVAGEAKAFLGRGYDILSKKGKLVIVQSDAGDALDGDPFYSRLKSAPPVKTKKAYKLFRTLKKQPGKIFPLFIGKTKATPVGEWIEAEFIPTKGFSERPGWHVGVTPFASHLMKKDGTMQDGRVWAEVEIPDDVDWQSKANLTKTKDIQGEAPEGGHYSFKRPPSQGGEWLIAGAIKVIKVLTPQEVDNINQSSGNSPLYSKDGRILGHYHNGTITLIADNIKKGDAEYVLHHEVLHLLMAEDKQFSRQKEKILTEFRKLKETSEAVKSAYGKVPGNTNPAHIDEEALGYFLQEKRNHKKEPRLIKRVIAAVKAWMMRYGIPTLGMKEADFVALASQGISRLAKDKVDTKAVSEEAAFSLGETQRTPRYSKMEAAREQQAGGKSLFPEIQKRLDSARGAKADALSDHVRSFLEKVKHGARHFPLLDPKKWGNLTNYLRIFEEVPNYSKHVAEQEIKGFIKDLSPAEYDVFRMNIILADMMKDVESGLLDGDGELPFGYQNRGQLEADILNFREQMTDKVKDSLKKRKVFMDGLKRDLVKSKLLKKEVLDDEAYYHHQVIEYLALRNKGTGTSSGDVRLKKKGWQRGRIGSTKDYNTEYVEAEFTVIAQGIAQLETKKVMDRIDRDYNIIGDLRQQARKINKDMVYRVVGYDPENMANKPTDEPFFPFRSKMARGFSQIGEMVSKGMIGVPGSLQNAADTLASAYEDKKILDGMDDDDRRMGLATHPDTFRLLSYLINKGDEGAMEAAMVLKAVADQKKFISQVLGPNEVTWRKLVPTEFKSWKPKPFTAWYMTNSVNDKVIEGVLRGQRGLEADDVRQTLTRGADVEWVLPEELADTLDNFRDFKDEGIIPKVSQSILNRWKQWILINPMRYFKYNLNNMSGDLDIVFAYQPQIIRKHFIPAFKDLLAYMQGKDMSEALKRELKEATRQGVIGSGMTVHDIPDITKAMEVEKHIRALLPEGNSRGLKKVSEKAKDFWLFSKKTTTMRENILRLAAYRFFKDQLAQGKQAYGVSLLGKVKDVKDKNERAALLARELLGDYGNLSQTSQWLRTHLIPFWSWQAINAPRYMRLFTNMRHDELQTGQKSVVKGAGALAWQGSKLSLKAAALYSMVSMWNALFFPEEEEELGDYGRRQLHLILGKRDDGSIISLRFQGALSDALGWFALEDLTMDIKDITTGYETIDKKATEALKAPFARIYHGARPLLKTGVEAGIGVSTYPKFTAPRPVRDKVSHVLRTFSMDKAYNLFTKPREGGTYVDQLAKDILGIFAYSSDPEVTAYYDTRKLAFDFMEKETGKQRPTVIPTAKSNALYWYKQSLRLGDIPKAEKFLKKYISLGGSPRYIRTSIKAIHPLGGIPKKYRRKFLSSLTSRERGRYDRALEWYRKAYFEKGQ